MGGRFMSDTMYGGRRCRTLSILDEGVREGVAIEIDMSLLPAEREIRVLEQVVACQAQPNAIRLGNGPERITERIITWCAEQAIELRYIYIEPGKPDQNAFIERYNRTYQTEALNTYVFDSVSKCARSVPHGCRSTTKSGFVTRWRGYRPPRIGLNLKPEILR